MNIQNAKKKNDVGFLLEAKEKLRDSRESFKAQQTDLFLSLKNAKASTKLIFGAIVLVILLVGIASTTHAYRSNMEKYQYLDELHRKIEAQEEANKKIDEDYKGNLDAYIEEQARIRLDMVYPDEEIYINRAG